MRLSRRLSAEQLVVWSVLVATTAFVVWQIYPSNLFRDAAPAAGDLTGHLFATAHLREHVLPRGRLFGWSMAWFTGFPITSFYFPLSGLVVALGALVLPINVALKLGAAIGPVTLPAAAYAFARLEGRDRLTSACYAVGVLPLLLEQALYVSGGSVLASASTGEYGYAISLSLAVVTLGMVRAGLRTGRHRAPTAVLFAAAMLFHILPAVLVVLGAVISLATMRTGTVAKLRWLVTVGAVSAALTAFWLVPFVVRSELTAGPDYERSLPLLVWMMPPGMAPVAILALLTVVVRGLARVAEADEPDEQWTFLTLLTAATAITFAVIPDGRVWNARLLSLWYLSLCFLAVHGITWLVRLIDEQRRRTRAVHGVGWVQLVTPVALLLLILPVWGSRLGAGILIPRQGPATQLPAVVLGGAERDPALHEEALGITRTLQNVAAEHGCGRTHWEWIENESRHDHFSTAVLLPHLTDGCIAVTTGLYMQSSATSPYVDIVNRRLSVEPMALSKKAWELDMEKGVAELRRLGVRYFIAGSNGTRDLAEETPGLRRLASTEPYDGDVWTVYEVVDGNVLVEPLAYLPVVVPGSGRSRARWERTIATWLDEGEVPDVVAAASGPPTWPRAEDPVDLPRRAAPAPAARVSDVRVDHERLSFRVSEVGTPVLVKVSYFPNWRASGAEGPWRVTPNQMVVVPTSTTVTLTFGRTAVDHAGSLLTVGGLVGVGLLATRGPVDMPQPEPPVEEERPAVPRPKRKAKKGKGRRR